MYLMLNCIFRRPFSCFFPCAWWKC